MDEPIGNDGLEADRRGSNTMADARKPLRLTASARRLKPAVDLP
jgi:hypothetical protein